MRYTANHNVTKGRRARASAIAVLSVAACVTATPWVASAAPVKSEAPIDLELGVLPALVTPQARTQSAPIESEQFEAQIAGHTADGLPARAAAQFAPALPELTNEEPEVETAPQEAIDHEGVLPAHLVGGDFVEGDAPPVRGEMLAPPVDGETDPVFTWAVTPATASMVWADNADRYEMRRDGQLVSSGETAAFSENQLVASTAYSYELTSFASDDSVLSTRLINLETPSDANDAPVSLMTYQPYSTAVQYDTFIPNDKVSMDFATTMGCGFAGQSNRFFGGDNRSWRTPPSDAPWDAGDHRSMAFFNVNWDEAHPNNLSWVFDVGSTKVYHGSTLEHERTASVNGIKMGSTAVGASYAQVQINHEVTNPFCAVGAIDWDAVFRIWRSGTIEVVGNRYPVPNHEIYGRWNNTGQEFWRQLGRYSNSGFHCLTGVCGTSPINSSTTY